MKIKKLIKLLECIEGDHNGKLPQDMYQLGSHTKESGDWIGIDEMDFVHVMRAFEKMQSTLAEEERRDTQEGKVAQVQAILDKYVAENRKLRDKVYNLEHYDEGLQISVSQTNQIFKLEEEVSRLRGELERKKSTIDALIRENRVKLQENYELRHPRYVFSEIPNDCDGQKFTDDVKKYLNKGRYKMRVRGQHVKEEYKGTGVTTHGQSIDQSTHLRVYIEEK